MRYTRRNGDGARLPPGRYWLGDPSYGLDDNTYDTVWGRLFEHADGAYCNCKRVFAVALTPLGRCYYYTNAGTYLDVRSGALGIFSAGLTHHETEDRLDRVGTFIYSKSPVAFKCEQGILTVLYDWDRYIRIDTNGTHGASVDESELWSADAGSSGDTNMESDASADADM